MNTRLNTVDYVALILLIIGGFNWGLVGIFNFNLVATIFGNMSAISRIVYGLVGISAIYSIFILLKLNNLLTKK